MSTSTWHDRARDAQKRGRKLLGRAYRSVRAAVAPAGVPARLGRIIDDVSARLDGSALVDADVRRVHVGCGPHNLYEGWCNVDIRPFRGVDRVMDVTVRWPFSTLDYVYSEHFLEHLDLRDGVAFLANAGQSLRPGGKIRLSTPNLDWVMHTHFAATPVSDDKRIAETFTTNRAFHGWGHQFLYTEATLRWLLVELGYEDIRFFEYGESDDEVLRGLERHGGWSVDGGRPSVVIVEAERGPRGIELPESVKKRIEQDYGRFIDAGH